jgi:hypothetical protein
MPPVAPEIIRARAKRLRDAGDAALRAHLGRQTGKLLRVLTERGGIAHAEDFTRVKVGDVPPAQMINVVIGGHDGVMLEAAGGQYMDGPERGPLPHTSTGWEMQSQRSNYRFPGSKYPSATR